MKQEHFVSHVNALVKKPELILETLNAEKVNFLHAAIGISGEVSELYEVLLAILMSGDNGISQTGMLENAKEEIGDAMFYTTQLQEALKNVGAYVDIGGIVVGYKYYQSIAELLDVSVRYSGEILDGVKRLCIYDYSPAKVVGLAGQTIMQKLAVDTSTFERMLHDACAFLGFTVEEVREHNYNKLKARYPEGYTDLAAAERADKSHAVVDNVDGPDHEDGPEFEGYAERAGNQS